VIPEARNIDPISFTPSSNVLYLIPPTYSSLKQALYWPVFSLGKTPDKQTEPVERFSVTLSSKIAETGRSKTSGKEEKRLRMSPDMSFPPIRAYESTDSQKKDPIPHPFGTIIDAHP
jgi:hypothetical protein